MTTGMSDAEQQAVLADAENRIRLLLKLETQLRPEIDDCAESMSEWTWVCSQINAARQACIEINIEIDAARRALQEQ